MKKLLFTSLLVSTLLHADLLQEKDYTKLADCVVATVEKEGILKVKRENFVKGLKKNLPKLAAAVGLDKKITKKTVTNFRGELNNYSYTLGSFLKSEITVEQYVPINNCLQEIKNSIPENTQLALVVAPLQEKEDKEVRATLKALQGKVTTLLKDSKTATTQAATSLLAETQTAVKEEAKEFADELKAATQELKQSFAQKIMQSIATFLGVNNPTTTVSSTKKPTTVKTTPSTSGRHRKHGIGRKA